MTTTETWISAVAAEHQLMELKRELAEAKSLAHLAGLRAEMAHHAAESYRVMAQQYRELWKKSSRGV